jgi:hypothetical protein
MHRGTLLAAVLVALASPAPAGAFGGPPVRSAGAAAAKCKRGLVRHTVTYRKHKGGRRLTAAGCARRPPRVSRTPARALPVVMSLLRSYAFSIAPARVSALAKRPGVRLVARTHAAADAAAARGLMRKPAGAARAHPSQAIDRDEQVIPGPARTHTVQRRIGRYLNDDDHRGKEVTITTDTTAPGTRLHKSQELSQRMERCPDATGATHGYFRFHTRETTTIDRPGGGKAIISWTSDFDANLTLHYGDDARVKAIDASGAWHHTARSSTTARPGGPSTVTGDHSSTWTLGDVTLSRLGGTTFHSAGDTASDAGEAVEIDLIESTVANLFPSLALDDFLTELQSPYCINLTASPQPLFVKPGNSVGFSIHAATTKGAPADVPVEPTVNLANAGTVAPAKGQAKPDASFTYSAPAQTIKGGVPIRLDSVSKRGVGIGGFQILFDTALAGTVTIDAHYVVDPATVPAGATASGGWDYHGAYDLASIDPDTNGTIPLVGTGKDSLSLAYQYDYTDPNDPLAWSYTSNGSAHGTADRSLQSPGPTLAIVPAGSGQFYLSLRGLLTAPAIAMPDAHVHADLTMICDVNNGPTVHGTEDDTVTAATLDEEACPGGAPFHDVEDNVTPQAPPGSLLEWDSTNDPFDNTQIVGLCTPSPNPRVSTCPFAYTAGQPLSGSFTTRSMLVNTGGICFPAVSVGSSSSGTCRFRAAGFRWRGATKISWDLKPG